jgi:uncharacterized protein with predicted RNA binding PUA domain
LKSLPLDAPRKISCHIDALFGYGVSSILPQNLEIEYSKKTGRIKNFSIDGNLVGTFRTDGGIALTIFGAKRLLKSGHFLQNCIIAVDDALPFVSEGRSLFCRHVKWCGYRVLPGAEVAIIDKENDNDANVLAVGRSLFAYNTISKYQKGVAVKIREGIKSRLD